jgi:predicted DsbA family dithiol-disulfide isomerase
MKVEIWSDVVCPWCYLGKRRFEAALGQFGRRDAVEVTWRSFELDPQAPDVSDETMAEVLARKYGMSADQAATANARMEALATEAGLEYRLRTVHPANTFDAHRLVHFARQHGQEDAMQERLMRAYFSENLPLGDLETLIRLASEVGLDPAETRGVLESEAYAGEVREDEQHAARLGIQGVPFFVLDGKYGVSGAQSSAVLLDALERVWSESHPAAAVGGHDEAGATT